MPVIACGAELICVLAVSTGMLSVFGSHNTGVVIYDPEQERLFYVYPLPVLLIAVPAFVFYRKDKIPPRTEGPG